MISVFRGLAPLSFPSAWLEGFDMDHGFASVGGEARIRFPATGQAYGVRIEGDGPDVRGVARRLTAEEIAETPWGPVGPPFEPYGTAKLFGHAKPIRLDEVD
jgi:hypothetical protein